MADQEQGYRNILTKLFIEEDVPKAIELTIRRGSNAYSYYKYVRSKIVHNNAYRHKEYLYRVRYFQHVHFGPQDPEWDQLEDLIYSSLHQQYRMETAKTPYFTAAPHLDKALRMIHSVHDNFYEYDLPEELKLRAIDRDREARERKHVKAVTISNLQTIISKARDWRACKENPWQLVSCALLLCGRRVIEVIHTLEWEQGEGIYTARVTGIVKQDMATTQLTIPLLCPYEEFNELMTQIRVVQMPVHSHTHRLRPAFVKWFGTWYNHSQRRNLYGEAGFRIRDQTGFCPEMSQVMWIDNALCHSSNVIQCASNLTYQALVFTDER